MSLPFTLIIILLFPIIKIRLVRLCSNRIGHYALNTELLLCYLDNKKSSEKNVKYIFYIIDAPVCNDQLHLMWKRIIPIFPLSKIAEQINATLLFIFGNKYKPPALKIFETSYGNEDQNGIFQKQPTHLFFTDAELQKGNKLLSDLGMQVGARWVCLFARDSTYLTKYFPGRDWSYHDYRDCDIRHFAKAALFLANKGYVVLRMGKSVAQPFQINHPNVIDYANHALRSDFADIYLAAKCEFMISTSSGLDGVTQIFRRPLVYVDVAPFSRQLQYWFPGELFITKKIFDKTKQRFVSFKEINTMLTIEIDPRKKLNELNWVVIENNEDDIFDVVEEMEERITEKLGKKTNDLFYQLLEKSHSFPMIENFNFLKYNLENFYIRMGSQFLEKNNALFLIEQPTASSQEVQQCQH